MTDEARERVPAGEVRERKNLFNRLNPAAGVATSTATTGPSINNSLSSGNDGVCTTFNLQTCGWRSLNEADYRGTVNLTKGSAECKRSEDHNDDYDFFMSNNMSASLKGNKHCRNLQYSNIKLAVAKIKQSAISTFDFESSKRRLSQKL